MEVFEVEQVSVTGDHGIGVRGERTGEYLIIRRIAHNGWGDGRGNHDSRECRIAIEDISEAQVARGQLPREFLRRQYALQLGEQR